MCPSHRDRPEARAPSGPLSWRVVAPNVQEALTAQG